MIATYSKVPNKSPPPPLIFFEKKIRPPPPPDILKSPSVYHILHKFPTPCLLEPPIYSGP